MAHQHQGQVKVTSKKNTEIGERLGFNQKEQMDIAMMTFELIFQLKADLTFYYTPLFIRVNVTSFSKGQGVISTFLFVNQLPSKPILLLGKILYDIDFYNSNIGFI